MNSLKNTKTRELVLNLIKNEKCPISANDIFDKLREYNLTLSTIYRTLDTFTKNGILTKETAIDGSCIYGYHSEEHTHFLECKKCHKQVELDYCPYHQANESIEKNTDFTVDEHNLVIYGICKDCKNKDC